MNQLGWKTDLSKKVIETVVINLALMAAQEFFSEGISVLKQKFNKPSNKKEEQVEEFVEDNKAESDNSDSDNPSQDGKDEGVE